MIKKPVTKENLEKVRQWRNEVPETLRTQFLLTKEQQEEFYVSLCSRTSNHRYYELWQDGYFIGLGGITDIQWENRFGEISLIIDPERRGHGHGKKAVELLLKTAFHELNLNMVVGECYFCNQAYKFWEKMTAKFFGSSVYLPMRKYWAGRYAHSIYFSITKEQYEKSIHEAGH